MKIIINWNDVLNYLDNGEIEFKKLTHFLQTLKETNEMAMLGTLESHNHEKVQKHKKILEPIFKRIPLKQITKISKIEKIIGDNNCDIFLTSNIHYFLALKDTHPNILCLPLDVDFLFSIENIIEKLVTGEQSPLDVSRSKLYITMWDQIKETEEKRVSPPSSTYYTAKNDTSSNIVTRNTQNTTRDTKRYYQPLQNTPNKEQKKTKVNIYPRSFKPKMKLVKKHFGAIMLATSLFFGSIGAAIGYHMGSNQQQVNLPTMTNEYVLTHVTENVSYNDTVVDIAAKYFDVAIYAKLYGNLEQYVQAILKQNHLKEYSIIHPGDTLVLPVITKTNNEYFLKINQLRAQIQKIEKENLWLKHIVADRETYSYLATLASGNNSEIAKMQQRIIEKNNYRPLKVGDTVWIINPELGQLKEALKNTTLEFQKALSTINFVENEKSR